MKPDLRFLVLAFSLALFVVLKVSTAIAQSSYSSYALGTYVKYDRGTYVKRGQTYKDKNG
jgi:hypothetical protein